MIEFSELKEMPKALSKLQGLIKNPIRNKKAYNYLYADMDTVLDCIKTPCSENGFSVVQMPYNCDDVLGVETILIHDSGEYIKAKFGSKIVKNDPQSVGSQISYYRRYSLLSIFNLSQEDDDGTSMSISKPQADNKMISPTDKRFNAMFYKVKDNNLDLNDFNSFIKGNINGDQFKQIMEQLEVKNTDKYNIALNHIKNKK